MKIVKINKIVSFSLLFCFVMLSCKDKKDTYNKSKNQEIKENKENVIITELLDSITLNNEKFYLLLEYSDEKKYKLRHQNTDYHIPYFFKVGRDTVDLSSIKLDTHKNNLVVHIFQGNSGIYTYELTIDAKLVYIIKNEKDSLYINNSLNLLQKETKEKITKFINE